MIRYRTWVALMGEPTKKEFAEELK
jgi:hypothetical protein